jgi:hypothetical protein
MIDPTIFRQSSGLLLPREGGQELILHEICGAFLGIERIWLPFPTLTLQYHLDRLGHDLLLGYDFLQKATRMDGVYFGTPTIVDDRALFPLPQAERNWENEMGALWCKQMERDTVRAICKHALKMGARRIVSGLGSGDISVAERLKDMGGGEIITYKKFDAFEDWILCRSLV